MNISLFFYSILNKFLNESFDRVSIHCCQKLSHKSIGGEEIEYTIKLLLISINQSHNFCNIYTLSHLGFSLLPKWSWISNEICKLELLRYIVYRNVHYVFLALVCFLVTRVYLVTGQSLKPVSRERSTLITCISVHYCRWGLKSKVLYG